MASTDLVGVRDWGAHPNVLPDLSVLRRHGILNSVWVGFSLSSYGTISKKPWIFYETPFFNTFDSFYGASLVVKSRNRVSSAV